MSNLSPNVIKKQALEHASKGNFEKAAKLLKAALKKSKTNKELWFFYGQILLKTNRYKDAIKAFTNSLDRNAPHHVKALSSLTSIHIQIKEFIKAKPFAKEWTALAPNSADAHYLLGFTCWELKHISEAQTEVTIASRLSPNNLAVLKTLAEINTVSGKANIAKLNYEQILNNGDSSIETQCKYLMSLNYSAEFDDVEILRAHRNFGNAIEAQTQQLDSRQTTSPQPPKIRIGYISSDFRRHSVSYFFLPIIKNFNRDRFEVFCYSNAENEDDLSETIKRQATQWHNIANLNDLHAARLIKQDDIDILVDLGGPTGKRPRLGVFAYKPAKLQATYLGYPNTTGLSRMDYRLVDEITDPINNDSFATEQLYRLKDSFLCYDPVDAPDIKESSDTEGIVFGSFNAYAKITDEVIKAWGAILQKVPESKLYLKAEIFVDKTASKSLIERFEAFGIAEHLLIIEGHKPNRTLHLNEYSKVHVHLDTFPYNGTTTTFEALWMGVPTITLKGTNHRSRVGASIMTNAGLSDYVADSLENYIDIAVKHAESILQTGIDKKQFRHKMSESVLTNGPIFSKNLESFYQKALTQQN